MASEWNPNEGMLADQVLQADGQSEWVTARRLAQELLDEQPNPMLVITCWDEHFGLEKVIMLKLLFTYGNHWIFMLRTMNPLLTHRGDWSPKVGGL